MVRLKTCSADLWTDADTHVKPVKLARGKVDGREVENWLNEVRLTGEKAMADKLTEYAIKLGFAIAPGESSAESLDQHADIPRLSSSMNSSMNVSDVSSYNTWIKSAKKNANFRQKSVRLREGKLTKRDRLKSGPAVSEELKTVPLSDKADDRRKPKVPAKIRRTGSVKVDPFAVKKKALKYVATDRIKQLAIPRRVTAKKNATANENPIGMPAKTKPRPKAGKPYLPISCEEFRYFS